jgi:hypothetical protein
VSGLDILVGSVYSRSHDICLQGLTRDMVTSVPLRFSLVEFVILFLVNCYRNYMPEKYPSPCSCRTIQHFLYEAVMSINRTRKTVMKPWLLLQKSNPLFGGLLVTYMSHINGSKKKKLNSVACSPQANYTARASGRRLLAKLVPTFADRGCHVVSATNPRGR